MSCALRGKKCKNVIATSREKATVNWNSRRMRTSIFSFSPLIHLLATKVVRSSAFGNRLNMSVDNCFRTAKLSYKKYRVFLKKIRRKRIRQERAKKRDETESVEDEVKSSQNVVFGPVNELLRCYDQDDERETQHNLWLEREKMAQEAFLKEKERKEKIKQDTAYREKNIREEWEKQQAKDKEEKDKQTLEEQSKKEREAALLKEISTQPKKCDGPSHNPEPPLNFGTEMDRDNCPFFLKTGACRFGDRCSRVHNRPSLSNIILIPNMYSHFSMDESFRDEYDTDIALEYEESETYNHFREFYEDVTGEFKKIGRVIQFKTCCNHEPHLRGNVYVQYQFEDDALTAFKKFNGRWYAGKQISCEFATIARWKTAICGLYASKRCPKGRSCNFLHVFKNPRNEFHAADFDYQTKNLNSSHRSSRSTSYSSQNKFSRSSELRSRSRSKSTERSSKHRRKRSKKSRTRSSSRDKYIRCDLKTEQKRSKKKLKKAKKKKSFHCNHSDKHDSRSGSSSDN